MGLDGAPTRLSNIFPNIVVTPGVVGLAEEAKAYWLLDAIASHIAVRRAVVDRSDLWFWRIEVRPSGGAVLTCRLDGGIEPVITQDIAYTDFPLESADIWAGRNEIGGWTLYLPSEH